MKELNALEKIIYWLKSLFVSKEEAKDNSDEIKKEMCKRSLQSGVCPHYCDKCAWNTLE